MLHKLKSKKPWQQVIIIFAGVYLLYALTIGACKLIYDRPSYLPTVSFGQVDDWQYDPSSYHHDVRLFSLESIATFPRMYLAWGFAGELILTILILVGWAIWRNVTMGTALLKKSDPLSRKQGFSAIMIVAPPLIILTGILTFILCGVMVWADMDEYWLSRLVGHWFLLLGLAWVISIGYLFISGLFNWGSEKTVIKQLGKRKFFWSLGYGLSSLVIAWLISGVMFGSVYLSTPRYSNLPSLTSVNPNNVGVSVSNTFGTVEPSSMMGFNAKNLVIPSLTESVNESAISDTIGLAVGGAKDINNFRENIKNGYLPEPTDITYEGLFYDYYFDTGAPGTCDKLFCPTYSTAISPDPFTGQEEYFISVGLNSGMKEQDFARKNLNLMIVLDISGSMNAPFDSYYYDSGIGNNTDRRTKMEIANETIVNLLDHLSDKDRLSVVLFDHDAYLAKPFRLVKDTDMSAIAKHVLDIQARGGTDMSAGIEAAMQELSKIKLDDPQYDNRVIFITDAMPNSGDTSERGLFGKIRELALDNVYTTFVGVGVDLNSELISALTKVRGANYYAVHSALDFKRRLADEFEFMVTPLVFDLDLVVEAPGYEIEKVYGSPEADEATGKIMTVNTLFPSASTSDGNRGGLILLQMKKRPGATNDQITIRTTYQDRQGKRDGDSQTFRFTAEPEVYSNSGIQKGILLSRYASVLLDWLLASRYDDYALAQDRLSYPQLSKCGEQYYSDYGIRPVTWPVIDGRWERGSRPLTVSPVYAEIFSTFGDYFATQHRQIGDDELLREESVLDYLILQNNKAVNLSPSEYQDVDYYYY